MKGFPGLLLVLGRRLSHASRDVTQASDIERIEEQKLVTIYCCMTANNTKTYARRDFERLLQTDITKHQIKSKQRINPLPREQFKIQGYYKH